MSHRANSIQRDAVMAKVFAHNVIRVLAQQNKEIKQLATEANIALSTLHRVTSKNAKRKIGLALAALIADTLDVTLDELVKPL